jgi:hypothetical protein
MKKVLVFLTIATLIVSLFPVFSVYAQEGPSQCCKLRRAVSIDGAPCNAGDVVAEGTGTCILGESSQSITCGNKPKWGLYCAINTLNTVTDYIFIVLMALVVVLVIIGAFHILASQGDTAKTKTGQSYIIYAAAGAAVALLARAVAPLVKTIIGV